jgi:hypothetical protein
MKQKALRSAVLRKIVNQAKGGAPVTGLGQMIKAVRVHLW